MASANHFHDPKSSRPHSRRSSTRRSFASSLSRSSSYLDLPRTACPKDGDAFAYNPAHLKSWYCPQATWDRLPSSVQKSLAAVQHAGASALTGMSLTIFVLLSTRCAIGCIDARYLPMSRRMCCACQANLLQASNVSKSTVGSTTAPALTRRLQRKRRWLNWTSSVHKSSALPATLAASSCPKSLRLPTAEPQHPTLAPPPLFLQSSHSLSLWPPPLPSPLDHQSSRQSATQHASALFPLLLSPGTRNTPQSCHTCARKLCPVSVTPATRSIPSGTRSSALAPLLPKTCRLLRIGGARPSAPS